MDELKQSSAKSIINSLAQNDLIDLYKSLDKIEKTFPAVICFNPNINNDIQYTKELYQFILDVYKIYQQDNNSLISELMDNTIYGDTFLELFEDQLVNYIYMETDMETLEGRLQYVIDNTKDILKTGIFNLKYSPLFKMGLGVEESAKLIEFLDKHNARKFFLIKNLPLFSFNVIDLGFNGGYLFISHDIIDNSRIGCFAEERETKFIYIFK